MSHLKTSLPEPWPRPLRPRGLCPPTATLPRGDLPFDSRVTLSESPAHTRSSPSLASRDNTWGACQTATLFNRLRTGQAASDSVATRARRQSERSPHQPRQGVLPSSRADEGRPNPLLPRRRSVPSPSRPPKAHVGRPSARCRPSRSRACARGVPSPSDHTRSLAARRRRSNHKCMLPIYDNSDTREISLRKGRDPGRLTRER
jgi:hypothetical protein